ncbi:uncharacterized protein PRCAT00002382001 [Priceomyces carsonii]|uniref:uncharacterized protein n=1 Tax=Priceomyces carsonii TaxID=28549 RepID=UPI002EDA94E9|nr:unnamed protein product [Priceomyces carsonii]
MTKAKKKAVSEGPEEYTGTRRYSLWNIWVITLCLKVLLTVGYHSTDFEVHRNWLAITYNLPLAKWYIENKSQWTLDYPPFFAYFEWILSHMVPQIVKDDGCLDLVKDGAYGLPTIFYQRATVILSEVVLFAALQWYIDTSPPGNATRRAYVTASSLVFSPGLLIIDHMHFQYNGMLFGLLVLMINCARLEKYLMCGFWFSLLLCFKHIYLYLAPAVFVFLLRGYCLNLTVSGDMNLVNKILGLVRWRNLLKLGSVVISVFLVAFLPFVVNWVIPELMGRLFPFNRGLTHAYWAPNIWAIYSFCDRLLIQVYHRVPLSQLFLEGVFKVNPSALSDTRSLLSLTRGIVGDTEFSILPTITPQLTFFLTAFYQVMSLIPLFLQPNFNRFVGALTLCGFASFLFGWHVHEKAILLVIFPMSFIVSNDKTLLGPFNLLVSCAYVSLFPLIINPEEWVVKVVYTALWYIIYYFNFRRIVRLSKHFLGQGEIILDRVTNGYILGLIPLIAITSLFDLFEGKFEILTRYLFLKLIFYSVYCGIGIISSWNGFSWLYFVNESIWTDEASRPN